MSNNNPFAGTRDENKKLKDSCESEDSICEYLGQRGGHHTNYKIYYKTIGIVNEIVKNNNLILRRDNFNDNDDNMNLQDDGKGNSAFILCFSYANAENVAMWYMYGGNLTDNVMVKYTKSMLEKIFDENVGKKIEIGRLDKKKFVKTGMVDVVSIEISDVLYYDDDKNDKSLYYIKRGDEVKSVNKNLLDKMPHYLKKNTAWSYESECRLIVKVPKKQVEEGNNAVRILLPNTVDITKNKRLVLSPSFNKKEEKNYSFEEKNYSFERSKLTGKVNITK